MRKIYPEPQSNEVLFDADVYNALVEDVNEIKQKNTEQDAEISNLKNKTSYTGLTQVASTNVDATNISAVSINTTTIDGVSASFSDTVEAGNIESDTATITSANVSTLNASTVNVENLNVSGEQTFDEVEINSAEISSANITSADITNAIIGTEEATILNVTDTATLNAVDITSADMANVNIENASITEAQITDITITDVASIGTADIENASIDYLMNNQTNHSDYSMTLDLIQDNNDFYWVKIPSFKSGTYTITLKNELSEPVLSMTITNSFGNISFKYSKSEVRIMNKVIIKDDALYAKIFENGTLYWHINCLESVLGPASYYNYCPIDEDTVDYSITLNSKYGDIYTHYVIAQNLTEGGGAEPVGNQPLIVTPTRDATLAVPYDPDEPSIQYNGEDATSLQVYVPDQSLNKDSSVVFGSVNSAVFTTPNDTITIRNNKTTGVFGIAGITVKNYDGANTDITFGIDSNGNLRYGDKFMNPSANYIADKAVIYSNDGVFTGTNVTYDNDKLDGLITRAESDDEGNNIVDTYATKAEVVFASEKGAANGVATLDANGHLPVEQLPTSSIVFQGGWDASLGYPTTQDPDYVPTLGDYWLCTTAGVINGVRYFVNDGIIWDGTQWIRKADTDAVASVNGKIGEVVLAKEDIGLGNVENKDGKTIASENVKNLSNNISSNLLTISLEVGDETLSTDIDTSDIFSGFNKFEEADDGSIVIDVGGTEKSVDTIVNTDKDQEIEAIKDFSNGLKINGVLVTVI